jgi:hypothetical protein
MEQRFLNKVNKLDGGCWEWTGRLFDNTGYGQYSINSRPVSAHRHSYQVYKGDIPNGLLVRHTCDNRKCVNPDHLIVGTQQDNMNDMVERNRQSQGNTHYARTQPERLARGDTHGSKTHPEALVRGDEWKKQHHEHINNQKGSKNCNSKLTDDDVREIRIICVFAFTHKELAKMYGVSRPVMSKVIRGDSYKNISST